MTPVFIDPQARRRWDGYFADVDRLLTRLLLAAFASMAILKPLWSEHVGVFRNADGTASAGLVAQSAGARELLGWWSIPLALLLAALLYIALTKGLRALRYRR